MIKNYDNFSRGIKNLTKFAHFENFNFRKKA